MNKNRIPAERPSNSQFTPIGAKVILGAMLVVLSITGVGFYYLVNPNWPSPALLFIPGALFSLGAFLLIVGLLERR